MNIWDNFLDWLERIRNISWRFWSGWWRWFFANFFNIAFALFLIIIVVLYTTVCSPYWFKPITEVPLICISH